MLPKRFERSSYRLGVERPHIASHFIRFQKLSKQPAIVAFLIDYHFILFHNVSIHTTFLSVNKGVKYASQKQSIQTQDREK